VFLQQNKFPLNFNPSSHRHDEAQEQIMSCLAMRPAFSLAPARFTKVYALAAQFESSRGRFGQAEKYLLTVSELPSCL
jgi:hypothetical protein